MLADTECMTHYTFSTEAIEAELDIDTYEAYLQADWTFTGTVKADGVGGFVAECSDGDWLTVWTLPEEI